MLLIIKLPQYLMILQNQYYLDLLSNLTQFHTRLHKLLLHDSHHLIPTHWMGVTNHRQNL